jgi:effector-binding domain-containing protein
MLDTPEVVQADAQLAAVIHFTIPRSEIQKVMAPGIGELMATIAAQGITPGGPVFSHHFRMDPATFDFDVGVPVDIAPASTGRVKPGRLPAATVARTVYHGSYEGLGAAWGEFNAWITSHGYQPASNLWERYVAGPESDPDPATWRTELNRPLREA